MNRIGLGESLRHLQELTDGAMDRYYAELDFPYRARYTPVLRRLGSGQATVNQLKQQLSVTQGAVSQTLKLMVADGLVNVDKGIDGRQRIVSLSEQGQRAFVALEPVWDGIFSAIDELEKDIDKPLLNTIEATLTALKAKSFVERVFSSDRLKSKFVSPNYFGEDNKNYAKFRPSYPSALAQYLSELTNGKTLAVDVGCGSGQLTELLAKHFTSIIGGDPSEQQIAACIKRDNIDYQTMDAERLPIADNSADLVVAAQAAHWFDLPVFYKEAQRVLKPGGVLALVSYGVPYLEDPINSIFQQGYWQQVHQFWPEERRHVETGYRDVYFPFKELVIPNTEIKQPMDYRQLVGYIKTWSSYQVATKQHKRLVFDQFFDLLEKHWAGDPVKNVVWPLAVRATRV